MTQSIELLAPARNLETAIAAINAGADAIFIGGSDFGARSSACNSTDDLKTLCSYAHMFNVKVHVTLNTLLYDKELNAMQQIIYDVAKAGADVIIFQDLSMIGMDIPEGIELHASTQCDICTKERFLFYKDLNVSQVVLPREITLDEIQKLKEIAGDVRLEVFVAGALCVAQSGICFISELMTDRSANRGSCAQICRLPMAMYDKNDNNIADGHLISMKDNFLLEDLQSLLEAGATSFKIEGRLKDKEYVVNMVSLFSKKLNSIIAREPLRYKRSSINHVRYSFVSDPFKTFNRGFTSSMLRGDNACMVNIKTPKSLGESIGIVQNVQYSKNLSIVTVKCFRDDIKISNGDGFSYVASDGRNLGFMCNRAETDGCRAHIHIHGRKQIEKGTELYRNEDVAFKKLINRSDACVRHIPIVMTLYTQDDCLFVEYKDELGCSGRAGILNTCADGGSALDLNRVIEKCYKIKSESHVIEKVYIGTKDCSLRGENTDDSLFNDLSIYMPISAFNDLRYRAFDVYLKTKGKVRDGFKYKAPCSYPVYPEKYIDKRLVLNEKCAQIYIRCGVDLNVSVPSIVARSVMTCKNCLVKNHAVCKKEGGHTAGYYLKIGDRRFDIVCDCVSCKMHLFAHDSKV